MNRKKYIRRIVGLMLTSSIALQAQVTMNVHVLDEKAIPVADAKVEVHYESYQADYKSIKSLQTNAEGFASLQGSPKEGKPLAMLTVAVSKDGYYRSKDSSFNYELNEHHAKIVLRKRINPIPLYVKITKLIAPVLKQKLGYDFEVGDWVKPNGLGVRSDVFFEVHHQVSVNNEGTRDEDYRLLVSFPHPADGLQEFSGLRISEMLSSAQAPESGYQSVWEQHQTKDAFVRKGNRDPLRNYWMRIRSVSDEQGKLQSAHYLKIYGDFPHIQYYFNPTPNDRNLEFDPKRNLFKQSKDEEVIYDP